VADHRIAHPEDVPGCFGCKVYGIGYDGKHYTKVSTVTNQEVGGTAGYTKEHRDGRQDALITPQTVTFKMNGK
jgi:hypothetical protein